MYMSNSLALSTLERDNHEYESIDRYRGKTFSGTGEMVTCPAYRPHLSQVLEDEDDQGYMKV